jgi:hypothetical protein
MSMTGSLERIQSLLNRLAARQISLEEFQSQFVPLAWSLESDEAAELANEVELRLAEYSTGHWTEKELRRLLASLVAPSSEPIR